MNGVAGGLTNQCDHTGSENKEIKMTKKKVLTQEEIKQNSWEELARRHIPDTPTYLFKIGDSVELGNLRDVVIVDVIEGGKYYEVDFTWTDHNYGTPIVTPHQRRFVPWTNVRPLPDTDDNDIIRNKDLRLHFSQRQIDSLISMKYGPGIDMEPAYQRGYVWNTEDKVKLVDSVFTNVEIGKFVLIRRDWGADILYEVLDGKQRINALCEFYENKFEYQGLRFNNLSKHERNYFENFPISIAFAEPMSEQQKIRYFLTLNRTGRVMDEKHLKEVEKLLGNE